MSPTDISALIAVAGFFASVIVTVFIAGMGWGSVKKDIESLRLQLAEVKGMFVLRLRDDTSTKDK